MHKRPLHVMHVIANNPSVHYFTWFAEESIKNPDLKFSFVALTSSKPSMLKEMSEIGCECHWVPFDNSRRIKSFLSAIPRLFRLFKKISPDVIHSNLFDDAVPALIAAKLAGIRGRVITKQDTYYHWNYARKAIIFDKLNNKLATDIVAVSKEAADFVLQKEGAEKDRVRIIHHGISLSQSRTIDEKTMADLREKFNLKDKFVIGTVARFIDWKGYKYIIEAAAKLVSAHPELHFLLIGEGPQKLEIQKLIEQKNLANYVTLAGWVNKKDIPSAYAIMNCYLHAAFQEPFGFVIAEAMVNGLPVVSTATGAALDAIKHKENGYLVDYENIHNLHEGILFMLANDSKAIGEKGRITAENMFAFERMWADYIALYKEIAAR